MGTLLYIWPVCKNTPVQLKRSINMIQSFVCNPTFWEGRHSSWLAPRATRLFQIYLRTKKRKPLLCKTVQGRICSSCAPGRARFLFSIGFKVTITSLEPEVSKTIRVSLLNMWSASKVKRISFKISTPNQILRTIMVTSLSTTLLPMTTTKWS